MENRSNYAIVGGMVVAITLLMLVAIIWLARFSGSSDQHFDILFKQSINGLAVGIPVAFNGVPVGKIEEIKLLPDTPQYVRVRITVASDVPVLKGTTAAVEGVGFTGVSQIQLAGAMQGAERLTEKGPFGVPVIPPRTTGLGALLASAPELLANATRLTDRLTMILDDDNRRSLADILKNTDRATAAFADRAPEIAATLAEARTTLKAATTTLQRIDTLAADSDLLVKDDGKALVTDLRHTLGAARASFARIDELTAAARPGVETLTSDTLPATGALLRDLRDLTASLGAVAAKLDEDPAGALVGGHKLPDYVPPRARAPAETPK